MVEAIGYMRVTHKGYLLVADKSFEEQGRVVGAIFKLPTFESVEEFTTYGSITDTIKELKKKINGLGKPNVQLSPVL